jgi:hypothetical protein
MTVIYGSAIIIDSGDQLGQYASLDFSWDDRPYVAIMTARAAQSWLPPAVAIVALLIPGSATSSMVLMAATVCGIYLIAPQSSAATTHRIL